MTPPPACSRHRGRARARRCSATRSRPITSRRPASIQADSPAGKYLIAHGVEPQRLQLLRRAARQPRGDDARHVRQHPPQEPARARHRGRRGPRYLPGGEADVDLRRGDAVPGRRGVPLVVIAGKEYGTGSSRDWAAKGTLLLGVRAVIAESFERIHRSNLVGMGVLPLQFTDGEPRRIARAHGRGGVRDPGLAELVNAASTPTRGHDVRAGATSSRARAHRHAEGGRVLPPRRHPALRAAPLRAQA